MSKVGQSQEWKELAAKVEGGRPLSAAENRRWYEMCRQMDAEWEQEREAEAERQVKRAAALIAEKAAAEKARAAAKSPAQAGTPIITKLVQRKVNEAPEVVIDAASMAKQSLAKLHIRQVPVPDGEPGSELEYSRRHTITTRQ